MFELIMLGSLIGCVATTLTKKKEVKMAYSLGVTPEFIKVNCDVRAGTLYPCLKQEVYACLVTEAGEYFFGANWMLNNTVTVCPRLSFESGTRYDLCESECGQGTDYHAERQAITACRESGCNTVGATLYLTGHTYCCDTCKAAIKSAGIKDVVLLDIDKVEQVVNY
jgi:deoxycytidylate deaminase